MEDAGEFGERLRGVATIRNAEVSVTCSYLLALFISRINTLTRDLDIAILCVCLPVRQLRFGIR